MDGTPDDRLFETRRSGSSRYWLPLATPDRYLVIIGAMEWDKPKIGWRPWELWIEGEMVEVIDVYHRCGAAYRACFLAYNVWVTDGELNLQVCLFCARFVLFFFSVAPSFCLFF